MRVGGSGLYNPAKRGTLAEITPGSGQFELVQKAANRGSLVGAEGVILSGLEKDGLYEVSNVYCQGNTDNFTFWCIIESIGSSVRPADYSMLIIYE